MKINFSTSMIAVAAVLSATGAMAGNGSSTYDAAVSILSPDQSGFIIGGQVAVNGLGSGSVTLTRSEAQTKVLGSASSGQSYDFTNQLAGVQSSSGITSSIAFNRDIATAGSLVGQGSVTARGEAIASLGTAGAASANTTTAGTSGTSPNNAEGSATSTSSSQGSLNGSLSTANGLSLLGTSGLFAGSNALTVGETNTALSYGKSNVNADTNTTGINLASAGSTTTGQNALLSGQGDGALFSVGSVLHGGQNPTINLSVSNAGNGSIGVTTSTGGFFTGGAATGGSSALSQSGSFFGSIWN